MRSGKAIMGGLGLALLKSASSIFQVEPSQLPADCLYLPRDTDSGWWCCSTQSIPVEVVRGLQNMTGRSYPYVRAECLSAFPENNSTVTALFWAADGASGVTIALILLAVFSLFIVLSVLVTGVVIYQRRLRPDPLSHTAIYYRSPLMRSRTLPTILEERSSADLPNLVADVEAASARLAERLRMQQERQNASGRFGPACSTFKPGAGRAESGESVNFGFESSISYLTP